MIIVLVVLSVGFRLLCRNVDLLVCFGVVRKSLLCVLLSRFWFWSVGMSFVVRVWCGKVIMENIVNYL